MKWDHGAPGLLQIGAAGISLFLLASSCFAAPQAVQKEPTSIVVVYVPEGIASQDLSFSVSTSGRNLRVISVLRPSSDRPLLLILDPNTYRDSEMRSRIPGILRALAPYLDGNAVVRVGIPVLDGILSEPITSAASLDTTLDQMVTSYFAERLEGEGASLGRALDLIQSLVQKVEQSYGASDVLILARDRKFIGDEAEYLNSGSVRYLASITIRRGSTLNGLLEGASLLRDACTEGGGFAFSTDQSPESALRELLQARKRGFVLQIENPDSATLGSRLALQARASTSGAKEIAVRAPRFIYKNPDHGAPPNNYHMRQGLDWLRRARDSEIDENLTAAQRFVEASLQEDSWNPAASYLAGRICLAVGELPQAVSHLSRAVYLGATEEPVLVAYATAFRKVGRAWEAHSTIQEIAREGRALTLTLKLEIARLCASARSFEESRQTYSELVTTSIDSDNIRAEYGQVLAELGEESSASEQFRIALNKNPTNTEALLYFSRSHAAAGKHEEAMSFARKALDAHSKDASVQIQLGRLYGSQGDWEKAADHFQLGLVVAPGRREIVDFVVDALSRAGRLGDAVGVLERTLEADPVDVAAYRSLSALHAKAGNLSQAVETLEVAASRVPVDNYRLYREAAEVRERRKEYGQALLDYRAMLRTAPPEVARALEAELAPHLVFLSLIVHGGKNLTDLPIEKNSRMASTLSRLAERQETPANGGVPGGLRVPGGLGLLAGTLGVDIALLREADALEKMFSFMLEISSQPNERLQDNPLRRDVIGYLRNYDVLIKFLGKNGYLPANFDSLAGHELSFSLASEGQVLKRTQKFLSFFGVNMKSKRASDGSISVTLTLKQSKGSTQRQQLLRNLGANLLERNLRSFRIVLKDEEIPMLFGSETWSKRILAQEKAESNYLLGCMVMNPRAMRLYLAMSACSDETRAGLIQSCSPRDLLNLAPALLVMGRYLDFKGGQLLFPGTRKTWEGFLGVTDSDPARLISSLVSKDDGRALVLYYALAGASKPVQEYFSASPDRLDKLYGLLSNQGSSRWSSLSGAISKIDIGRVLRRLTADSQGLIFRAASKLAALVLRDSIKDEKASVSMPQDFLRLEQRHIGPLAEHASVGGIAWAPSPLDLLEFLRYAGSDYPELLTREVMNEILRSPSQALTMLDLVWDLHLPPDLALRYLAVCFEMSDVAARGWNVNRTRTSQALLHLLVLLHREGALSREKALSLVEEALSAMTGGDEASFARSTARFISTRLIPSLPNPDPAHKDTDALSLGLAGLQGSREFSFDGKSIELDVSDYRVRRMKSAIQQQRVNPLMSLLEIYRLLDEVLANKGALDHSRESLKRLLNDIQSADFSPGVLGATKQGVAYVDLGDLRRQVEVLFPVPGRPRAGGTVPQALAEIGRQLHTELGVSLLSYCYAYYGVPEADVLAFDTNFVRRHLFYEGGQNQKTGWLPTRLEQREGSGAFFIGTVAGLGFEFSRLETAQTVQSFGKREGKAIVPTILSGMRAMERSLRSDRAQEYVALSVRLGQEILALSTIEPALGTWCEDRLSSLVSPRRREQALRRAATGNPRAAAEALSPSELFLLGEEYLKAKESITRNPATGSVNAVRSVESEAVLGFGGGASAPENTAAEEALPLVASPALKRLRQILPESGSEEAERFRRELSQYGVLLRRQIGLNQLSMQIEDSYEQLENHPREEVLYERICDLKIRMADLNYALGLPAYLAEVQGELAIRDILPAVANIRTNSWKLALEQISKLNSEHARNWIEELLNRGILNVASRSSGQK